MPGFEVIDQKERKEISKLFLKQNGILFAHGFDKLRKNFHVREFEKKICNHSKSKYCLAVSSGTAAIKISLFLHFLMLFSIFSYPCSIYIFAPRYVQTNPGKTTCSSQQFRLDHSAQNCPLAAAIWLIEAGCLLFLSAGCACPHGGTRIV